jgi:hypothetical protein
MATRTSIAVAGGLALALAAASSVLVAGCKDAEEAPALSKPSEPIDISKIPTPPADGPQLGATADVTPVLARPERGAKQIGYLHAGAKVARSGEPVTTEGCAGGWYAVRPRGFVCADQVATTDLEHPTLVAMSLQPRRDQPLPYTYARVHKSTKLYKRDPKRDKGVVTERKLSRRSGLAVVGSWTAQDDEQQEQRLGLLTSGLFVPAADLQAAEPSAFKGVELEQGRGDLPLAFIVKRGVRRWKYDEKDDEYDKGAELEYHEILDLTGKYREKHGIKYWAVADGTYVRHRDVTAVRRRNVFPDFASADQKWIDISIITGTAVLYEGKKPVFATLVSVGRDRLGDPKETASTAQGDFEIVAKHVTAAKFDPKAMVEYYEIHDVPWVLELSSGQLMHGAYWHDRFGIEHGPGHVAWSPSDAQWVWNWATPSVPSGWHGVTERPEGEAKTIVRVRK